MVVPSVFHDLSLSYLCFYSVRKKHIETLSYWTASFTWLVSPYASQMDGKTFIFEMHNKERQPTLGNKNKKQMHFLSNSSILAPVDSNPILFTESCLKPNHFLFEFLGFWLWFLVTLL
jgi:hypothetical protein